MKPKSYVKLLNFFINIPNLFQQKYHSFQEYNMDALTVTFTFKLALVV